MGLSPGQIIGVVIVTCALLLILIIVVWYKVSLKRRFSSLTHSPQFMKKRSEHHHHQQLVSQKVAPISEKLANERKMSFHQLNVNRAQHFRDRALVAEREAKYVPSLILSPSP
jgi:hypothetical protein